MLAVDWQLQWLAASHVLSIATELLMKAIARASMEVLREISPCGMCMLYNCLEWYK